VSAASAESPSGAAWATALLERGSDLRRALAESAATHAPSVGMGTDGDGDEDGDGDGDGDGGPAGADGSVARLMARIEAAADATSALQRTV
jgi:hypothetical protein